MCRVLIGVFANPKDSEKGGFFSPEEDFLPGTTPEMCKDRHPRTLEGRLGTDD